jgi:protein-S-isoprenylcysteine O-methyltransferase Ste14
MSDRSLIQRKRRAITWLFGVPLGALVIVSESYWDARGSILGDVLFLMGLALVGVATVGRLWCSLYISGYKSKTLITVGPYSACRNPLYFFSLLGGIGIGLSSETLTIALLIAAAFLLYYPFLIRAEEKDLRDVHGDDFDKYMARTPTFCPSFARFHEPEEYTVRPKAFRKGVFDAMFFVWIVGVLELVEALHAHHLISARFRLY